MKVKNQPDKVDGRREGVRDRIVGLRRVKAAELVANPKNWRRHPERQRRALQELLESIGYADVLLARDVDGRLVLIDGHLRQSLDPDQVVPVLVLDVTEREADTLLATLDPIAALAGSRQHALAELLDGLSPDGPALAELLDALAARSGVRPPRPVVDPDAAPPLPDRPRSARGDLWILGGHRLVCGDARDPGDVARLMDGYDADVLWTDPPYGVAYVGKTPDRLQIAHDDPAELAPLLRAAFAAVDAVLRPGAPIYVCSPAGAAAATFAEAVSVQGWRIRQHLVWLKDSMVLGHADYHYRHEPILYAFKPTGAPWGRGHDGWHGGNAETSVFEVPRPKTSPNHPTAKPVELIRRCLANSSVAGDRVLDPFAGSGSAIIASELLHRRCFALEIDPRYVDVAVRRWESFTGRQAELRRES